MSERIAANSVLPARREEISLHTSDGLTLVGELALPEKGEPRATIICLHPLPTHGGMMDSHVFRKMAWRLPALAEIAILRFNFRGARSARGVSEGEFDQARGEGEDLVAAVQFVRERGLPKPWLVGWSFGTDVILRHAPRVRHDIAGVILLSPPLRWTTPDELARWRDIELPVTACIPELDDFLPPALALPRFAAVPRIEVVEFPEAKHLWVGERFVGEVLNAIVERVAPMKAPLPEQWDGPMERWSDL